MNEQAVSYYGKPIIKETVWQSDIPKYFFFGGIGGTSAMLAGAARLAGNDVLARRALLTAAVCDAINPYYLIKDLGRPMRFYNMLRVVKVTSPMSVGTWILGLESGATMTAAGCEVLGIFPRLRATGQAVAALFGPAMSTYTGALVADSVVPAWHDARRELPFVFAGSAAAAGGGAQTIVSPAWAARPARRLAVLGGVVELAASRAMKQRLGELVGEAYEKGEGGRYSHLSDTCTVAGTALMALAGRRRAGAVAAGALLLAGSWCKRFAVYHAGKTSAADPTYTSLPQRTRATERGQPAVTR